VADAVKWVFGEKPQDILTQSRALIRLRLTVSPNPFNTQVEFLVSSDGKVPVSLTLVNSQGLVIENLIKESTHPNQYNIQWQPDDLPAGIYYAILKTASQTVTKKMVLLK